MFVGVLLNFLFTIDSPPGGLSRSVSYEGQVPGVYTTTALNNCHVILARVNKESV